MWRPGWRSKAVLQQLFSAIPGGDRANYVLQRRVTHTYPVSDSSLASDEALGRHHAAMFDRYGRVPLGEAQLFEFGAGWDLAMPLVLRRLGARHQVVVDLRPLARDDLVIDVARRIGLEPSPTSDLDELLDRLGIDYRAPIDARATGLPSGSIDLITSTNTLEHIPPADISAILRECHRILAPDGVMSFQVDYKDHYAYFDRRLSTFAFLRHSPSRWRWYNPSLHHQNRLRHPDYVELYSTAGFDTLHTEVVESSPDEIARVESLPPHPSFRHYATADLAIRESRIVLAKRAS